MRYILWDHYDAGMGGIERLIVTLATALSSVHKVVVIAKDGGTILREPKMMEADFLHLEPDDPQLADKIFFDDLLIDFGSFREQRKLFGPNPFLLLWRVFPSIGCKNQIDRLLAKWMHARLHRKDSLVFMDDECHRTACRELHFNFKKKIASAAFSGRAQEVCRQTVT